MAFQYCCAIDTFYWCHIRTCFRLVVPNLCWPMYFLYE